MYAFLSNVIELRITKKVKNNDIMALGPKKAYQTKQNRATIYYREPLYNI